MRKKSDDELGTLVTREMKAMLLDETLTKEERLDILLGIMFGIDTNERLLASMVKSLKVGFDKVNKDRYEFIENQRKHKSKWGREHRTPSTSIEFDRVHKTDITSKTKQNKTKHNIPPISPRGGDGNEEIIFEVSSGSVKEVADAIEAMTEKWGHLLTDRKKLERTLLAVMKKNGGAEVGQEIVSGLKAHGKAWEANGWEYATSNLVSWLLDGKWREKPPKTKKSEPEVGAGCGECGVEIV